MTFWSLSKRLVTYSNNCYYIMFTGTGKTRKAAHRQVNGPSEEGSQGYLVTSLRSPLCNVWPALRDENGMPMAVALKIQDRLENKAAFSHKYLLCER